MRRVMRLFRGANFGSWIRRISVIAFIAIFAAATPNLLAPEPPARAVPGGEPVDYSTNVSDPLNNHAYAPDNAAFRISGSGTWEAWLNPSSCANSCTYVGKSAGYVFRINSTGNFGWALRWPNDTWFWTDTPAKARFNTWQHVAWVKNGANLKLYVDGEQVYETNAVPATMLPGGEFSVQNRRDYVYEGFIGRMDEFRLWNVARTQDQIKSQMHTRASGTGLQVYYDFNDVGSGSLENQVPGAAAATNLRVLGDLSATDVKLVLQPTAENYKTTYVFPRTYITRDGGWRVPSGVTTVDLLAVGGGGGGGAGGSSGYAGGGGGGAEVLSTESVSVVPGSNMSVVVGQGGIGGQSDADRIRYHATSGQTTIFGSIDAIGGGRGGSYGGLFINQATGATTGTGRSTDPATGASGGGGALYQTSGAAGTAGLGNAGGGAPAVGVNSNYFSGGAGGGVLGAGTAGSGVNGFGGTGGPGIYSAATRTLQYYGAGGSAKGCKAAGGTAFGATAAGSDAIANTGSGGGGGGGGSGTSCVGNWPTNQAGGYGGTGVIAISFVFPQVSTASSFYYPFGPQTNVPLANVLAGGWEICY